MGTTMAFCIILAALNTLLYATSAENNTAIMTTSTPDPMVNTTEPTLSTEEALILISELSTAQLSSMTPDPDINPTGNNPTTMAEPGPTFPSTDNQTVNPTSDTIFSTVADGSLPVSPGGANGSRIPIYLSAYFTFGGGWDGSGILPACQMALEHINEREDILTDYDLKMVWSDTQCQAGLGTRVFFQQLYSKPQKIMILGPACSTATQAVAETAYYWNLVTMSYGAASSALSDREKFPFFYRTYMPDAAYNPARIRLLREFGWTRVATIHETHELFSLAIDDLLNLLKAANITTISSEIFSEDPKNQIRNLKSQDAKIIISNMYEDKARRVFCEAYKQKLTGPDYVWIIIGWYKTKWWQEEDPKVSCTLDEMQRAVAGAQYFATESLQLSTSPEPTIAGISPGEYEDLLRERMKLPENQAYVWNSLAPYGYDATWAIALALDKAVGILKTKRFADGRIKSLEDFTYDDREMADLFFTLLNETEFPGVSGPVGFRGSDRVGITQIEQLQGTCEAGWHNYRSSCFRFVSELLVKFEEAKSTCASSYPGASLANIEGDNELQFLLETWMNNTGNIPDQWWIHPREDTNSSEMADSHCTYVDFVKDDVWQTADCNRRLPFICRTTAEFVEQQIALYNALDDSLEWRKDIVWPGDGPPLDRTPEIRQIVVREYQGLAPILYFSICGVTTCCVILSLFFLSFNIKYRQQRHVKMSSPNLNNLIILGGILVYLFVAVSGLDTNLVSEDTFGVLCYMKTWILSVGFVLAFGALFSKTWRVHRVAAFKTPKRRIVTDGQLFIMVFVLLLVDVVILFLWQLIDPLKMATLDIFPRRVHPDSANTFIQPYIRYCTCDTLTIWLGALYGYKGLLLIFGTFLAWETRQVSIPGLNDSKLIGISVYNVVILCLIGVAVSVVINNDPEALFLFVSCIILFCTSITLTVVFVPKIIAVVKHPEGDPNQPKTRSRTNNISETSSGCGGNLSKENKELKHTIKDLEDEINAIKKQSTSSPPGNGKGCGFWSCGLVCGCNPSREKGYIHETSSDHHQDSTISPADTTGPSTLATASV
ncbi:gamma-aminobutyric acid type B receptor subunit 1-like [Asterias amurensis]|uniref:gamma-aminobutyric acid type B receptor subunit 1-like n=1 Tax=Asterias amurensis TaxID=7602 RepID=UPI003AB69FF7